MPVTPIRLKLKVLPKFPARTLAGDGITIEQSGGTYTISAANPLMLAPYTVASAPDAATVGAGAMIFVTNETGGAVPAFSDGLNWRRVTDRSIIA